MDHDIVLAGDGLTLRPFRPGDQDDLALLVHIADDPVSQQWSRSLRSIHDADSAEAWVVRRLGDAESREWVVQDTSTSVPLGRIGLHRHHDDSDIEIGYWTSPEARGQGVARRATRLVARYAHDELGLVRVGLVHAVANPASCRVALGASLAHEGTHRAVLDHGDGVLWDMHTHARLAEDPWDPIPPNVPARLPRLEGDVVVLRAFTVDDGDALRAAAADPLIAQWNPIDADHPAFVERFVTRVSFGADHLVWAIADPDTDLALGRLSLHKIDLGNSCGEVGYWMTPAGRGRGLAAAAVRAVTSYAFDTLALHRLELFHSVQNPRSCRVAEKAGYELEAVRRLGYRYPDGRLHDEHLHAIVRPQD